MLCSISVENYALIDRLEMALGPGLNIVTGETGAGKSILLGALGLLLGTRGEAGVQKDGSKNCVVEGVFALDGLGLEPFFADSDLEYAPQTTVRRVISASGKSRAYVNDLPVALTVLRELGDRLIDIHSQHENLLLKDDRFRTSIVDGMAGQIDLVRRYGEVFADWKAALRRLEEARREAAEVRRDEDYIRHQADELAAAKLVAGEQETLEYEEVELSHADEIREVFESAAAELGADEIGLLTRLRDMRNRVEHARKIHPQAAEFAERLGSVYLELKDMEREFVAEYERVEGNPERLATVTARLAMIYNLQQKHRVETVENLLELLADFEAKLEKIDHGDEQIRSLEAASAAREKEARELAAKISAGRRAAAGPVAINVVDMLRRLEMAEAQLIVEVADAGDLRSNGADEVRFLFTANSSVAPRPIEKIASGGEISRVMLALKSLSARSAGQPTVIFDEIDTGVSGRTADAMGDIIAELGAHAQVLNITHLPQIAAKKGEHFLVFKQDGATQIRPLSADDRVAEIAKMLSGSTITDAALKHAHDLLNS